MSSSVGVSLLCVVAFRHSRLRRFEPLSALSLCQIGYV